MKRKICDICDNEISEINDYVKVKIEHIYRAEPFFDNNGPKGKRKYDVCLTCFYKAKELMGQLCDSES